LLLLNKYLVVKSVSISRDLFVKTKNKMVLG
jgi:hypothetical protein